MEKDKIIKRDGLKLAAKVSVPNSKKFNLVIFAYGFMGMMAPKVPDPSINNLLPVTAKKLQDQGMATIRFDFNGHGDSDGPVSNMSIYNELEDLHAVLQYGMFIEGVDHIYLVGHSQGGVLSAMMAGFYKEKIDKLVICSPAATLVDDARMGVCWGKNYDSDHVPAQVDMGKFKLNGWYFRTAKFINVFDVAREYEGRTLIIHGAKDEIVNNYVATHFHALMSNSNLKLIPKSDHNLHQNRELVYKAIVDFLTK